MKYLFLILALRSHLTVLAQQLWKVDSGKIQFHISNAGFDVLGSFSGLQAEVEFSPERLTQSKISGSLKASTINTGIRFRDNHLLNHEYFDTANYPLIKIESITFRKTGNTFIGTFFLTIKDVKRQIEIPFSFDADAPKPILKGKMKINRLDFKIGEESLVLSNNVDIDVWIALSK